VGFSGQDGLLLCFTNQKILSESSLNPIWTGFVESFICSGWLYLRRKPVFKEGEIFCACVGLLLRLCVCVCECVCVCVCVARQAYDGNLSAQSPLSSL
jgi:hypothetical protein